MKNVLTLLMVGWCCLINASTALEAKEFEDSTFLRDAEIEETLKAYVRPLFKVAGLNADNISIHLVADKQVNAMATVGYQFILFTGFLLRAENVGQVIGVLAHETGHINDGHIARIMSQARKMNIVSLTHILLGAAAAVAGSPEAGIALGLGGMGAAQGNFLHYHQGQEAAADHFALLNLEKLGWSAAGLGEFLQILKGQEYFSSERQDPYLRTHPFTQDRISTVKGHLEKSKFSKTPYPKDFENKFKMMQAKLLGYLFPAQVFAKYPESDASLEARYARAIASYRQQDLKKALPIIEELVKENKDNPYFWELKAQMLFENGNTADSLNCYEKAVALASHSDLIKVQYAQALIEMNAETHTNKAEKILKQAHAHEKENPLLWHLLAVVYGRKKNEGLMALALAEAAFLKGDAKAAQYQVNRALQKLSKNSSPWIRAQDLSAELKVVQDENS